MKRSSAVITVFGALLVAAGATWAVAATNPPLGSQLGTSVQLGAPVTPVKAPACPTGVAPSKCLIVLTRSTAVETLTDGVAKPVKVSQPGEIVSFTIGLAQLSTNATQAATYIKNLNTAYGGAAQAQLTIVKPGRNYKWTVVAEGPVVHLQPYLGYVVQFPLTTPLQVTPSESVALTVPTWAPILSYNLTASKYQYRQSRTSSCTKPAPTQTAQLVVSETASYLCAYPGTRVEYSATELTNPVAPTTTKTTTTPKK
jgi:hypothetical protein